MKVAIVGAGISGLALAAALHREGLDVTVYEKSPTVRGGGSGITLAPNALAALDSLGIGAPFRERQRQQGSLQGGQRSPRGTWLMRFPSDLTAQSLVIARDELHTLLASALPRDLIRTGTRVEKVAPLTGTLTLHDCEGPVRSETFDLVVGADSLLSAVRKAWPEDPGTRYAGYAAWRGLTKAPLISTAWVRRRGERGPGSGSLLSTTGASTGSASTRRLNRDADTTTSRSCIVFSIAGTPPFPR